MISLAVIIVSGVIAVWIGRYARDVIAAFAAGFIASFLFCLSAVIFALCEQHLERIWRLETRLDRQDYAAQKSHRNFERLRKRLEHFSEWPLSEK